MSEEKERKGVRAHVEGGIMTLEDLEINEIETKHKQYEIKDSGMNVNTDDIDEQQVRLAVQSQHYPTYNDLAPGDKLKADEFISREVEVELEKIRNNRRLKSAMINQRRSY